MITAINIDTNLWNEIISQLKSDQWIETYKYDNFDAGIDFNFLILEKEGEEVLFGQDNWFEGEIQCIEYQMEQIEKIIGITLKKGEPENLKPAVIKLYRVEKK